MNEREIWFQWVVHRQSTRDISRKFDLEECDVERVIARCMNAHHDGEAMPFEKARRLMERGVIEVAPLAFMRGRTLNDSFVILDEAQNTTSEQMKMFLTRLGFDSKAVITGDVTQIDLPSEKPSGLVEAIEILKGVEGIGFMRLTRQSR